jgi:hypothetical protein
MRRNIGYFEADGSYNERDYMPHKRQPQIWDDLNLDFNKQLSPQVDGRVSMVDADKIDQMRDAYLVLLANGALPGNWGRKIRRQIQEKVIRCMASYRKQLLRDFMP